MDRVTVESIRRTVEQVRCFGDKDRAARLRRGETVNIYAEVG